MRRVLAYDRLRQGCGLTDGEVEEFATLIAAASDMIALLSGIPAICAHAEGDIVLAGEPPSRTARRVAYLDCPPPASVV